MNGGFVIKISDLLLQSGSKDTIHFEKMVSKRLPNIIQGIDADVTLEHLNKEEIYITIDNGSVVFSSVCDRCGSEFEEIRLFGSFGTRCVIGNHENEGDDDIILIDEKNGTINLEDFIVDQIHLKEPLKKLCINCQKNDEISEGQLSEFPSTIKRK